MYPELKKTDQISLLRELLLAENGELPDGSAAAWLRSEKMGPYIYYRFKGRLSAEREAELKLDFMANSNLALKRDFAAAEIRKSLNGAELPFVFLKGSALGDRVYPTAALRYMCDMDIFVAPEKIDAAFEILKRAGWVPQLDYGSDNHLPILKKYDTFLELHFELPGVRKNYTAEFCRKELSCGGEKVMSDEWNFALLFCHAARHRWDNWVRFMSDAVHLAKMEDFDFEVAISETADMGYGNVRIFFDAFQDFFPRYNGTAAAGSEARKVFEKLFINCKMPIRCRHKINFIEQSRSGSWLKKRLLGLRFSVVRYKYDIPHHRWDKTLLYWMIDLTKKIFILFRLSKPSDDHELTDYLKTAERAAELLEAGDIDCA